MQTNTLEQFDPKELNVFSAKAEGFGSGILQLTVKYNEFEVTKDSGAKKFNVSIESRSATVTNNKCSHARLDINAM